MWRFDLSIMVFDKVSWIYICYLPFSFSSSGNGSTSTASNDQNRPSFEVSCHPLYLCHCFWLLSSPGMQTLVHILSKTWDSDWSSRKLYLSPVRMWTSTCLHSRMVTARLLWGSSMRASTSERVYQRKITVMQRTAESGRWPHDSATGPDSHGDDTFPGDKECGMRVYPL